MLKLAEQFGAACSAVVSQAMGLPVWSSPSKTKATLRGMANPKLFNWLTAKDVVSLDSLRSQRIMTGCE